MKRIRVLKVVFIFCTLIISTPLVYSESDPVGGHPMLPLVEITNLRDKMVLNQAPVPVEVSATVAMPGDTISNVDMYVDGGRWQISTSQPYKFNLYVSPGYHRFLARAFESDPDEFGLSPTVNIAVGQDIPPQPTPYPWQIDSVGMGTGKIQSLVLDEFGNAHAVYVLNNKLYYGEQNGSSWQSEIVLDDASRIRKTSIAIDKNGTPHIAYVGEYPYVNMAQYATKSASGWLNEVVSTGNINNISLSVFPDNRPALIYTANEAVASQLRYCTKVNGEWTKVVVDSHGWVVDNPSLNIDKNGKIRMVYGCNDHHQPNSTELRYIEWSGWWDVRHVVNAIPNGHITNISLAVDSQGNPKVAFITGDGKLAYSAKYDNLSSNNWAWEVVESSVAPRGASLVMTSSNEPVISFVSGGKLKLARKNNIFWYSEEVESNAGAYSSIKLDSYDRPRILYDGSGTSGIKFAQATNAVPPPPDRTPPSISISSPSSGATVSGTILISGIASDENSLSQVEIRMDTATFQVAQGTTSWQFSLNTKLLSNSTHTVTARATDSNGNSSTTSLNLKILNSYTLIQSIQLLNLNITSATVSWSTMRSATCSIELGTSTQYGSTINLESNSSNQYAYSFTPLSADTTYHIRILANDADGFTDNSGDVALKTLPNPPIPNLVTGGQNTNSEIVPEQTRAYPNPVLNGPLNFLVQVRAAEEVHLRIYDDLGQLIHETQLFNPTVLNGQLAYRYVWNISTVSGGTYLYVVEAKSAGTQVYYTKNKFAVIK